MPKTALLKDSNYGHGMNDVDDPAALGDGYCAELANAYPGYPVKRREGIDWKTAHDENGGYAGGYADRPFFWRGKAFFFFWTSGYFTLSYLDVDSAVLTPVKFMGFEGNAGRDVFGMMYGNKYSFEPVGGALYVRFGQSVAWQNNYNDDPALNRYAVCNMLAIEMIDGKPFARFVPPSALASDNAYPHQDSTTKYTLPVLAKSWAMNTGEEAASLGVDYSVTGWFGFSATLVRRASEVGSVTSVYEPGLIEMPESAVRQRSRMTAVRWYALSGGAVENKIRFRWYYYVPNEAFGFTHVRIYRTRNFAALSDGGMTLGEIRDTVMGATRYYFVDIPINYNIGNDKFVEWVWEPGAADDEYEDLIERIEASDGELTGEANTLQSDKYVMPPADWHLMKYHKERMFLLGKTGTVWFSEIPGGDGGTDLEMANQYPEKYALWYSLYNRYELRVQDGVETTAIASFDDDLYFFKTSKIWCLVGGMPPAVPRIIDESAGCPQGETVAVVKVGNESKLFFVGAKSPMLISAGGYVREFTEFKCRELWPLASINNPITAYPGVAFGHPAVFWDNNILVCVDGVVCGYSSDAEYPGAFKITPPVDIDYAKNFSAVVLPDGRMFFFVNMKIRNGSVYFAFGGFNGAAGSSDRFFTEMKAEMKLRSRRHIPGPLGRNMAELYKATLYCKFDRGYSPFTVEVKSNRFTAKQDYNENFLEYINNQGTDAKPEAKAAMRTNVAVIPESDFMGERFEYEIVKASDGGVFDLYGAEMEVIPRPNIDSDDLVGGTANVWVGDAL